MNHELICSWLGLPPGEWPPDHYRLLGLTPGESDAALIEQRVHERLDSVRGYQMMHPEQATEAMNRLAQAFVCLTDPVSKKAYDTALLGEAPPTAQATAVAPRPEAVDELDWLYSDPPAARTEPPLPAVSSAPPAALPDLPLPLPATKLDTRTPPPPLRQPPPLPPLPPPLIVTEVPVREDEPPAATPVAAVPPPPAEPVDPVIEAAQTGPARHGIATKRGLYQRIAHTRRLIRAWNSLGKFLSSPRRRLNRTVEGPEMVRALDEITALLRNFPPLLGEAGQPGYLVLALTQVDTVKVFQSFSPHQREALTRDWRAGVKLLTAHRDFLRRELRAMRKRPLGRRLLRATWSVITEKPGTVLLLLALLAINVALWRSYAEALWEKLVSP
jgi:hypothetical protein